MKRALLTEYGSVDGDDFDRCWDVAFQQVIDERCFPDDRGHRRQWERALEVTRPEFRACWLGERTAFQEWSRAIMAGVPGPDVMDLGDAVVGRAVA
jgi:hypothetical protein